jgi:hypothetical protein
MGAKPFHPIQNMSITRMVGTTVQITSSLLLPENCIGAFPFFLEKWMRVQIMKAEMPIIKMKAMIKINRNALSTPSARFDAPVNIIVCFYLK